MINISAEEVREISKDPVGSFYERIQACILSAACDGKRDVSVHSDYHMHDDEMGKIRILLKNSGFEVKCYGSFNRSLYIKW